MNQDKEKILCANCFMCDFRVYSKISEMFINNIEALNYANNWLGQIISHHIKENHKFLPL